MSGPIPQLKSPSTAHTAAPKQPAEAPPERESGGLHRALRGASHAEGEALLRPPESAPSPTPARNTLAPREAQQAWDTNRREGLSVAWLSALQAELGVPVTGTSTRELVEAVAQLQASAGLRGTPGVLDAATRAHLVAQLPGLAGISERPEVGELTETRQRADGSAPEDAAIRGLNIAPSYAAYAASLRSMDFLGHQVVGHTEFLARLNNAVAYLQMKFPGRSSAEIGSLMGIVQTSHFRTSRATSDQMYHGLGFALDLNPRQNDWHFGNGSRGTKLSAAMRRVSELFGQSFVTGARDMTQAAREGTTDEVFASLNASNEALRRYRSFHSDPAALEAYLSSEAAPEAARQKGAARWRRDLAEDERWFARYLHENPGQAGPAGFMDFKQEIIVALRDAAGLRWGGADLGGDNGDLMHFDGGTMPLAQRIRARVRDVRARSAR